MENIKVNDRIEFDDFEKMNAFIKQLNYKGIVYRQILPLVIVIDYVNKPQSDPQESEEQNADSN